MDPIKNLISGTDPLHHDDSQVPDGEDALRRMFSEPAAFTDTLPGNVVSLAERKRRRARIAGLVTLAAAAVTAGVLVAINLGPLTAAPAPATTATPTAAVTAPPTPTATPSATATPSPTATATPTAAAPAGPAWTSYTESTGQASFDIKPGWIVVESPHMIDGHAYNSLQVRNEQNQTIGSLALIYDRAAGGCETPRPFRILDAVVLDIPQNEAKVKEFSGNKGSALGPSRFTFAIIEGDRVYGSLALSEAHTEANEPVCAFSNGIVAPEGVPPVFFGDVEGLRADGTNAPLVFNNVAEAQAYMQTQAFQDLKRMLVSLSLKPSSVVTSQLFRSDAAKAQFSLPTGWTAKDVPAGNADFPASGIDVYDEAGVRVAGFYDGASGGVGGACGPEKYKMTELDTGFPSLATQWSIDAAARFSYRVLDQTSVGKGFSYQVGLVDKSRGALTDSCLMYSFVGGAPKGTLSFADRAFQGPGDPAFATMEEAIAYMGTPEYRKLKEMISSLSVWN